MRAVQRGEIVDYATYNDHRTEARQSAMAVKTKRRIHVGAALTFLFENRETVIYQVHEMMRIERIVRESDIQREIDTYNELLGGPGELGCTLLIEIDDPAERDRKLKQWLGLTECLYVEVDDGARIGATWDPRQVGLDRLSAVQYLKFDTAGRLPVAVGCDHPDVDARTVLTDIQRAALAADLADRDAIDISVVDLGLA